MMVERLKSRFGEGVGGACNVVTDANAPSFDPAEHKSQTDKKIRMLMSDEHLSKLSDWERSFLMDVYGVSPLSRKQHIRVWTIFKKHTEDA